MKDFLQRLGRRALRVLVAAVPLADDTPRERLRKLALLVAVFVFIGSSGYLFNDMVVQPVRTESTNAALQNWYYGEDRAELPADEETPIVYPEGMMDSFRSLYCRNQDVCGWLTFSTPDNDLFQGAIDNPVVQAADNEKYLKRDFLGKANKAGTLYFDFRNDLSASGVNRHTIIYGHNLNSGLMFTRFNLLVSGKVGRARQLSTVHLSTLYEKRTYKVFAVMVIDADINGADGFDYIRTTFDEASFETFIQNIRARSLYDFGDVSVDASDELLTMSTCSNKRDTGLKNGRTVIVARRTREGESTTVDTSKTVLNEDVLMPRTWYAANHKQLPAVYE